MIVAMTHNCPSPAIGDIGQVQAQHFAGAQAAIEHEPDHGEIAPATQLRQQLRDLLGIKRSR
jgi:hypothetical protein